MSDTPENPYNKFGFDTDFFEVAVDAVKSSQAEKTNAIHDPEGDIEAIKAEAFAAGKAEGAADALKTTQAELQDTIRQFQATLENLHQARTLYLQKLTQNTHTVLAHSLEHLVGDAAQHYPQDILHKHLNDILPFLPKEDQMILRIHPSAKQFHEKLQGSVATIKSHVFKIETDAHIHPGDCMVIWQSGGLDATLAEATSNMTTLLKSFKIDETELNNAISEPDTSDKTSTLDTPEPTDKKIDEQDTPQEIATDEEVA